MVAPLLIVAAAGIVLTLGAIHLSFTFFGPELTPRDPALQEAMTRVSPVLTRETTMWKAWVGFNASHSMGAILFGLLYGHLALVHDDILFASPYLLAVGLAMLGGFVVLGWRYWFSVPFRCICLASACYVAGIAVALA